MPKHDFTVETDQLFHSNHIDVQKLFIFPNHIDFHILLPQQILMNVIQTPAKMEVLAQTGSLRTPATVLMVMKGTTVRVSYLHDLNKYIIWPP